MRAHSFLKPFGGYDASDARLERVFFLWLPNRALQHVPGDLGLPEMFAGNVWRLSAVHPGVPAPEARVAARAGWCSAAVVVLVIEEYLRFGREAPVELAACATLCWAEDLVRAVPGHPLRSTGDRP